MPVTSLSPPPRRRRVPPGYWVFLCVLVVALSLILGAAFTPTKPDKHGARSAFEKLTRCSASDVSNVYYDSISGFWLDEGMQWLRFSFPNDAVLERYLHRNGLQRVSEDSGFNGPSHCDWWPAEVSRLEERYKNAEARVAVDRQAQTVFVIFDRGPEK